ncbi:unnamed protein product [Rotaria sp. Silwood1]|nr:unnamed protein product [Rotaria sp. Silwood1]
MNPANIIYCLSKLFDADLNSSKREISQSELKISKSVAEIINTLVSSDQFNYEDEITLDLINELPDYYDEINVIETNDDGNDADDEWDDKENLKEHYIPNTYSIEFMKEVVDFADAKDSSGKRRRSWKTVKHRYRSLPDQNYISRFRKYLSQQGTKRQKTQNIDQIVYKKFLNAREQFLPMHDIDIQRWALQAAKEMNLDEFQASHFWLATFKNRHGICSRKITNIVTKREINQVEIEKELHSTRTLSFQGEKKTLGRVSSRNATTHSYTIQPTISLDGRVIGPMFLCLQETNGRKLTNSLVRYWRDKVLVPSIGKKTLLLSDSWTGQNDNSIYQDLKSVGKAVHRIQIPPKTTSDIQPLDKYFNRQIKNLAKKLYNRVALDQLDINLHERNNIIKLVSLIHNQISAPIFKNMILYSWFASGYLKKDPSPFKNVNDVCFPNSTTYQICQTNHCDESAFITCSWCSTKLCFNHFFIQYHFHG